MCPGPLIHNVSVVKTIWPWALISVAVIVGALAVAPAAAAAEEPAPTPASDFAAQTDAPGAAVAVVDLDGRILDESTFGRDGNGVAIDEETPFVWGSVSKSILAASVLSSGVDPELPVTTALPFLERSPLAGRGITVGDLLNHTSGLPHLLDATDHDRRSGAIEVLEGQESPLDGIDVGERGNFNYSSLNYLLLQAIAERQGDLRSLLERVAPGAITSYDDFASEVPPGHVPMFGANRPRPLAQDHAGLGYGYLAGSVRVLAKYAATQARARVPGGPAEHLPGTIARNGTQYKSGWYVTTTVGGAHAGEIFQHSGAVPGFFTHVELAPEKGKAVVILANRYGEMESGHMSEQASATSAAALGTGSPAEATPAWGYIATLVGGAIAVLLIWVRVAFAWRSRATRSDAGALLEATGAGLAAAAAIALPAYLGFPVALLTRWAPDIAILLCAFGGFAVLLAAICAVTAVSRPSRRYRLTP